MRLKTDGSRLHNNVWCRINVLAKGYSGITLKTLMQLVDAFNGNTRNLFKEKPNRGDNLLGKLSFVHVSCACVVTIPWIQKDWRLFPLNTNYSSNQAHSTATGTDSELTWTKCRLALNNLNSFHISYSNLLDK